MCHEPVDCCYNVTRCVYLTSPVKAISYTKKPSLTNSHHTTDPKGSGGVLYICWVRGRAIQKGIDFHDLGIRNSIDSRNFGIRSGTDCYDFGVRNGIDTFWRIGIRLGTYF